MAKRSSPFPETRWSLLGRAEAADDAVRREALGELVELYLAALRRFLVRGMRIDRTQADDILQEFMVSKVIAGGLLSAADPARGKFRNFLVKALRNHTISELRRSKGYSALVENAEDPGEYPADQVSLEDLFQCVWAQQVVVAAVGELEQECKERGRDDIWQVFRLRLAEPALHGAEPVKYEDLVKDLHIETPRKAINLLTTGSRMFRRHLESVVVSYAAKGADLESELRDLRKIIAGDGMSLVWGIPDEE